MASKFREILDEDFQTTSPESDVKLEDILNAADAFSSSRSRTSSEASSSSGTNSSSENVTQLSTPTRTGMKEAAQKRRSRILSFGRR